MQSYASKGGARRAARKQFKSDTEFELTHAADGRWSVQPVTERKDLGPRSGTKLRVMFDKLCSQDGICAEEITSIYGYASGCWGTVQQLAKKYGYEPNRETEDRKARFFLKKEPSKADKTR